MRETFLTESQSQIITNKSSQEIGHIGNEKERKGQDDFRLLKCVMEPIRYLDLFSGTGSFRRIADEWPHWQNTSLDLTDELHVGKVELLTDIMNWDYKALPADSFDIITGSPPCELLSQKLCSLRI